MINLRTTKIVGRCSSAYGVSIYFEDADTNGATVHTCAEAPFVGAHYDNGRPVDAATLRTLRRLARRRFPAAALWSI